MQYSFKIKIKMIITGKQIIKILYYLLKKMISFAMKIFTAVVIKEIDFLRNFCKNYQKIIKPINY
jgi:hypothetical protein